MADIDRIAREGVNAHARYITNPLVVDPDAYTALCRAVLDRGEEVTALRARVAELEGRGAFVVDRERVARVIDDAIFKVGPRGFRIEATLADAAIAEYERQRAEAERERAALAAWSCVECEARFPQRIDARLLDGVTRCSSCAEKDYLGQALGRARADLAEARALLGEIDRTLRFIPEAHHFRNSIDARLRAFAEGGK